MTREEIIAMAREAGIGFTRGWYSCVDEELERFAALVAAYTKSFCPICNQRDAVRAKFDEESG